MKNKNNWNRCKALFGLALLACTMLGTPAAAITAEAAVKEDTVAPCAEVITWQYKIEDNKLYKRLWNGSAAIWLTDWIFVRDLSEDL